ncbi:MAG: ROK family protein [Chloroflexota bacterium]
MDTNEHSYVLGIDIGGTKTAAALVDSHGKVTNYHQTVTPALDGPDKVLATAIVLGKRVLATTSPKPKQLVAVGIGTAGQVDCQRGIITYATDALPDWQGTDVRQAAQNTFDLPVAVDNDVNAMAFGEMCHGAGRPFNDVLYISVGTGVGGALVYNKQVQHGATWTAGELGNLVIRYDVAQKASNARAGCLEAYTSGPAIAQQYAELTQTNDAQDLRDVVTHAHAGDQYARQTITEGGHTLGMIIGSLLCVLNPEAVIVGGGVSEIGDLWWRPFEQALRANPLPGPARVAIQPAQLGRYAVIVGAGCLAFQHIGQQALS